MAENKFNTYNVKAPPKQDKISRFLQGALMQEVTWGPFIFIGVVLALLTAAAISLSSEISTIYVIYGIVGLVVGIMVLRTPELGAYLLIVSEACNISNNLTDQGLLSINRALIALTVGSVLINYMLKTGKFNNFPKITRSEWALLAYYAVVVTSIILSSNKATNPISVIVDATKDILVGGCLFLTLNTKEKWIKAGWTLVITLVIISILGDYKMATGSQQTFGMVAQYSVLGQVNDNGSLRFGGAIGESNFWGMVLVSTLPFILLQIKKRTHPYTNWLLGASAAIIFLAFIYTGSRGASISFLAILPLLALEMHLKPLHILTGIVAIVLILILLPAQYVQRFQTLDLLFQNNQYALAQDQSIADRQEIMLTGMSMFENHPILGVGFGNFKLDYWDYASKLGYAATGANPGTVADAPDPHSLYVQILSETGLLGMISFAAFCFLLAAGLLRTQNNHRVKAVDRNWRSWIIATAMAFAVFLISGFFLHSLLFRYMWIIIGMALAAISISDQSQVLPASGRQR